ncbi:putative ribonuclease H-like domain-containing protein [Tanacetum coccineum]
MKHLKMNVGLMQLWRTAAIQDSESLDSCRFALWEEGNWAIGHGKGLDFVGEVFATCGQDWCIRIFLDFASYMGFIVYQMDVKSAFLYGKIDEEVYVSQPLGFIDPKCPKKVYKVVKALYGLHQVPKAWYATLSTFLLKNGYRRGTIDKTLFIKKNKHDIILVQVYVDDIIFGSTKRSWCDEFEALMKSRFQMSSIGELTFFLRLQVKQKEDGIFISQDKYVAEILKKFDFVSVKTASTPIETQKPLVKDEEASDVDVHLFRSMIGSLMYLTASRPDIMFAVCACSRFQVNPKTSHLSVVKRIFSDYAGENLDKKSTTGGCQFLGRRLISWQCKKQTIVATSTTEAEYVAAANCCGQVLWIQNQMLDYEFNFMNTKIYIDNEKSLGRALDGTEALLLPKLFILWLAKVSTDSAKLIPLGKDSTAIETLKKIPPRDEDAGLERPSESQPTTSPPYPSEVHVEPQSRVKRKPNLLSHTTELGWKSCILEVLDRQERNLERKKIGCKRSLAHHNSNTTTTNFRDDETITQVLLNMSQSKTVSREKEKGVELKDIENIERPRPTSTRSLLTLKPLPKNDPKDKGKRKIEEDESDTESEDINETEKKFKMLAHNVEIARKVQEDWEAEEEVKKLAEEEATNAVLIQYFDDIKARIKAHRLLALRLQEEEREQFTMEERAKFLHDTIAAQRRVKRFDKIFTVIGSNEDERKIKELNEGASDPDKKKKFCTINSEIMERKSVITRLNKVSSPKGDYFVIYRANGYHHQIETKVPAKPDVVEQGTKKRKGGHMKMLARKRKKTQSDC